MTSIRQSGCCWYWSIVYVLYIPGIYTIDVGISLEVTRVERKDMRNSVYFHGGSQVAIVDLDARHGVCNYHPPPFLVHGRTIVKYPKRGLNLFNLDFGMSMVKPQPIPVARTGANIPKLSDILGHYEEQFASRQKLYSCRSGTLMHGVLMLCNSQQYVCIN